MEHYGVRGLPLEWFKSYLSHREQYVIYNGEKSPKQAITCGVPQGSILGPLLFLIYINDLSNTSDVIFALLFADDTNMFIAGKDPNQLIRIMNTEVKKIVRWLHVNKLSLNVTKTHFIIFRGRRKRLILEDNLYINDVEIDMVNKTKFLGVIIDKNITFSDHIQYIKGKIARGIGILCKVKRFVSKKTLITLYYSFIYPYFNYCVNVWGNTYQYILLPLFKLQKRAVRLITGAKRFDESKPLFAELRILPLANIYVYSVQLFLFKFYHDLLPDVFANFFVRNGDIHGHNTRNSNCFRVPSTHRLNSIRYTGVSLNNYFLDRVNYNCTYLTYKKNLKKHRLHNELSFLIKN